MNLTHLTARRGPVNVDTHIAPVTYITGPNGSGKSTILDLIRLGISGPDRVRIGSPWSAALTFSDGLRIDRSVSYDTSEGGDVGDLRHDLLVYDAGIEQAHGKIRVGQTLIDSQIGGAWTWSAGELFAATPPERRKLISKLLGPSLTAADALVELARREAGQAGAPSHVQARLEDAVRAVKTAARVNPDSGAEVLRVWLDGVRAAKTQAQADAASYAQVLLTVEQRLKDANAPEGSVGHAQDAVDAARATLASWRERTAAAEATRAHIETMQRQIAAIRKDVDGLRAQRQTHEVSAPKLDALLIERQRALAGLKIQLETDTQRANACIQAWQEARDKEREAQAAHVLADHLRVVLDDARGTSLHPSHEYLRSLLDRSPESFDAPAAKASAEAAKRNVSRSATAVQTSEREVSDLEHQLGIVRTRLATVIDRLEAREQELTDAEAQLAAIEPPPVDEMVQAQIAAATSDLAAAEIRLRQLQTYEVLTEDRDRAAARSSQASAARTALHQFERHVEQAVSDLYTAMVGPLIGPASAITTAVLGASVVVDPTHDWWVGLGQQPIEHLSESTTAIVGVALHAAVVQLAKRSRWRSVLLDGAEVIQDDRRLALLRALGDAELNNVVMASVDDGIRPHTAATIVLGDL